MSVGIMLHNHLILMEGDVEDDALMTSSSQDGMSSSDAASSVTLASPHQTPDVTPTHESTGSPDVVPGTPEVGGSEMQRCNICERLVADVTTVFLDEETKAGRLSLNACGACTLNVRSELVKKLVQGKLEFSPETPGGQEVQGAEAGAPLHLPSSDSDDFPMQLLNGSGDLGGLLDDALSGPGALQDEQLGLDFGFLEGGRALDRSLHTGAPDCPCRTCELERDMDIDTNTLSSPSFTHCFDNILSQPCEAIFNATANSAPLGADLPMEPVRSRDLTAPATVSQGNATLLSHLVGQRDKVITVNSVAYTLQASAVPSNRPLPGARTLQQSNGELDLENSSARTRGRAPKTLGAGSLLAAHLISANHSSRLSGAATTTGGFDASPPVTSPATPKPGRSRGRKPQRGAKSKAGKAAGRGVRGGGVGKGQKGGATANTKAKNSRGGRGQASQGRMKQAVTKKGGDRRGWSSASRGAGAGRGSSANRAASASRGASMAGNQALGDQQKASKMFRCKTCQKTFSNWRDVDQHQKSNECDHGVLICKICDQRFSAPEVLYRHYMSNHHGAV